MVDRFILRILLLGLTLFRSGPICEASSLGMTVHVVPQSSDGGKTVGIVFFYFHQQRSKCLNQLYSLWQREINGWDICAMKVTSESTMNSSTH